MCKKYSIVYADPPWKYANRREIRKDGKKARRGFGASSFYNVLSEEDICSLNVEDICEDNAALFMWATWPRLDSALKTITAWGFEYKTVAFVWVKTCLKTPDKPFFGVGYYTKSNTEICMLGVRGRMPVDSNKVSQILVAEPHPRDAAGKIIHSKKPDEVRDCIDQLYPHGNRIELFARESIPGWDVWGDEV